MASNTPNCSPKSWKTFRAYASVSIAYCSRRGPASASLPASAVRAGSPDPVRPQPKRGKGIRTLDEITIEGELDVPQVLFITARDRQRYFDHLHRAYLRNSLEIGLETVFPERVIARIKP